MEVYMSREVNHLKTDTQSILLNKRVAVGGICAVVSAVQESEHHVYLFNGVGCVAVVPKLRYDPEQLLIPDSLS